MVEQNRDRKGAAKHPAAHEPLADARGSVLMLDLHKSLAAAKRPHEQTNLQRQMAATDRQIDRLVYEFYAPTDEEIRIVEKATER